MVVAQYAVGAIAIVVAVYLWRMFKRSLAMPPGPWGFPFIGNLPFMDSKKKLREHLDDLAAQYGDIFCFRLGEHQIVGIQKHDAIQEAYSLDQLNARPDTMQIKMERFTGFASLFFGDERDRWSDYRKMATRVIGAWTKPNGREYLDELLEACSDHYLSLIEESQGEAVDPMMTALSVVFPFYEVVIYGGKYDTNSAMIQSINQFFEENSDVACNEFNMWIDHMPLLQRLKSSVREEYKAVVKVFRDIIQPSPDLEEGFGMVQEFRRLAASGQSFSHGLKIENLMIGVFLTAIDMATAISWMFALLASNQHVTDKLRRIVQTVGAEAGKRGVSRLQAIEQDPYIKATVYEIMRYSSECFGIPRSASEDVWFRGYLVPKGAMVIGNTTAGNYDPKIFPEPESFKPERFIAADGSCDPALQAKVLTYSIGKRRCLGEAITTSLLSAIVAKVAERYQWEFGSGKEAAIAGPILSGISRTPGEHTVVFTQLA